MNRLQKSLTSKIGKQGFSTFSAYRINSNKDLYGFSVYMQYLVISVTWCQADRSKEQGSWLKERPSTSAEKRPCCIQVNENSFAGHCLFCDKTIKPCV